MGKFLKPCIGLSVGKLVRSVQVTAKLSTELRSSGSKFGSQKFGRFGVRLMVARSSFRLAYNKKGSDILLLLLDKNGCITPGCGDSIYLLPPVANSDLLAAQEMAFRFSPNPANENIQIHFLNTLNQKTHQIRLNAMDGTTITSYPLTPGIQDYTIDLSNQHLPKGTYILQYIREGHLVQAEKVVIVKE